MAWRAGAAGEDEDEDEDEDEHPKDEAIDKLVSPPSRRYRARRAAPVAQMDRAADF